MCEAIPSPVMVAGGCGRTLATMPGPAVDPPRCSPLVRRESAVCFQSPERPPGTECAQFIRFCSGLKLVYMYTRMPQGGLSTFTRLARKWRGEAQLLSQCLRATNCYKLRVDSYAQHCRSTRPSSLTPVGAFYRSRLQHMEPPLRQEACVPLCVLLSVAL